MKIDDMRFYYFFILFSLYIGSTNNVLIAQQPYLKHFSVDDGLPSNEIYQVLEDDSLGHLLIITDRGVARFDGYSFETVPAEKGQHANPYFYGYKNSKGKIYVAGLKGVIYLYSRDSIREHPHHNRISRTFSNSGLLIVNTLSEKNDSLWINFNNTSTYSNQVGNCILLPDGTVKVLSPPPAIYFDLRRSFFFRQLNQHLPSNHKMPLVVSWPDGSTTSDTVELKWQSAYIRRLFHEKIGHFNFFSIGRKIVIYQNKTKTKEVEFTKEITHMASLKDNLLAVGFETGGVIIYKIESGDLVPIGPPYLTDLSVSCIYQDKQGGIWFSTYEGGMFYMYPSAAQFVETCSSIRSIETRGNKTFVACQNGVIEVYEKQKMIYRYKAPLPSGAILVRIGFDHTDSVFVITNKERWIRKNKSWESFATHDVQILPVSGNLIYGASGASPVLNIHEGNGKFKTTSAFIGKRIMSMKVDKNEQLWLGTWEGLFRFKDGKLQDLRKKHPAFQDRILSIRELRDKRIVVATLGSGIVIINEDSLKHFDINNGLNTSVINSMATEGNQIWLGTNKGLTRIDVEKTLFRIDHFGIGAGLPTTDVHEFTITNGWLYLNWGNKLVSLSADKLETPPQRGKTYFTSVTVNGKRRQGLCGIQLDYNENDLEFIFNSINLSSAANQHFKYKLLGFEDKWSTTSSRYLRYTSLPPGTYELLVMAAGNNHEHSGSTATFRFTIQPAVWQRWWFIGMIALAGLAILLTVFGIWYKAHKKKNQLLLDLAESQQHALAQLINPHFIFNILNNVQSTILSDNKIQSASLISRFARLMRMSLEMSKQKFVPIQNEISLIESYLELEMLRAPGRFDFNISYAPDSTPSCTYIPTMLIQPFIENAVKHGIMHKVGKGHINVYLYFEDNSLFCIVDDNGIGRDASGQINKNILESHQSSGIEITLKRLQLSHKLTGTKYHFTIQDKCYYDGKAMGTTVTFTLPYKVNYEKN